MDRLVRTFGAISKFNFGTCAEVRNSSNLSRLCRAVRISKNAGSLRPFPAAITLACYELA